MLTHDRWKLLSKKQLTIVRDPALTKQPRAGGCQPCGSYSAEQSAVDLNLSIYGRCWRVIVHCCCIVLVSMFYM
ncbi:hypothetical protein T4D_10048 [Trichinella pseudospiralis]|uniref:Uncharacterized protein n=1 Tax=Trichinella pseudospiralis TaxID=6337 RepID=A0A0V1FRK5_TRIPS|nr:hypothetical protein T4D_10048 [Trichinella pseudospiralis]